MGTVFIRRFLRQHPQHNSDVKSITIILGLGGHLDFKILKLRKFGYPR